MVSNKIIQSHANTRLGFNIHNVGSVTLQINVWNGLVILGLAKLVFWNVRLHKRGNHDVKSSIGHNVSFGGLVFVGEKCSVNQHSHFMLFLICHCRIIGFIQSCICNIKLAGFDPLFLLFDFFRNRTELKFFFLEIANIVTLKNSKLIKLITYFNSLFNKGISDSKSLYLCIVQNRFIYISSVAFRDMTGKNLAYESLLCFKKLPRICVKTSFGNVPKDLNGFISVSLPQNTTFSLNHITGTPRDVKMM